MGNSMPGALANPSALGFCPDRTRAIMDLLQSEVQRKRLPGAVALVARHGQVMLHASVGQQDPQAATPMALDSIFRIYSMTKPIVSVAVMMLMERGKLLLGAPVAQYLPEFAQVKVASFVDGQPVLRPPRVAPTVQDLLRHTAGLTYEITGDEPIQRMYAQTRLGSRERTNREFARALAALPLMFEPATTWDYSRATDLLGALVEVVSGQSLGDFLRQEIFGPLGMVDTGFAVPPAQQHRIVEPFAADPDGLEPMKLIDLREVPRMEAGGAGLASTTADYARFLQCLLSGGALAGHRLLSPATVRYMTADHLGTMAQHATQRSGHMLAPGVGFGLGFAVRLADGMDNVAGTRGMYWWGGVAGTTFFVDPVKDLYAIMMTQAPNQRDFYRPLFRNLVYAALLD